MTVLDVFTFLCGGFAGWCLCRIYIATTTVRILRSNPDPASPFLIRLAKTLGVKHHGR